MSFAARRLLKQFRREDYRKSVNHSFLHPNQKVNIFKDTDQYNQIYRTNSGQVVTIDPVKSPTSQILYFHGGAFTVPMNQDQLTMITTIATAANSRIQVADFPLLPNHRGAELLEFAKQALTYTVKQPLPTFVVADSAGAALGLQAVIQEPAEVVGTVLVSPWLDMQLTDPSLTALESADVMLDLNVLKQIGGQFAAGLKPGDWVDAFDPVHLNVGPLKIFYGENELLTPINEQFITAAKKAANATVEVTRFKDGFHDYPLWTKLPETKKTVSQIAEFITSQRDA